ncbi:hypothetical protein ACVWYQ_004371 [Bradyrhizobium sp. USDA 3397]
MSSYVPRAPDFARSLERLKARPWNEPIAEAFEQGLITTTPGTPHAATAKPLKASRLVARQRPRSLNRQASRDRRRRLGGSSAVPDTLRHYYTEGQRSVLCIIAGEIKHHGVCDLPIGKIAALAGVCRTTVQTTLHEGRRLFHLKVIERPMRGRKSLTNLVEIVSAEWRAWISRAPSAHRPRGSNSVKMASTTKNKERRKEDALRVTRGDCHQESVPQTIGLAEVKIESVDASTAFVLDRRPKRE